MRSVRGARSATWSTGASLGHVDLVAPEHRFDPLGQPGSTSQRDQ
jgi:hypothetical protein